MQLQWTSVDGESITIGQTNSSTYTVANVTGLGNPMDCDILTQRAPWQHGQTTLRALPQGREIKFNLIVIASSQSALQQERQYLGTIFSPVSFSAEVNIGLLEITRNDGEVYAIDCVAHGIEMPAGSLSSRSSTHQVCTVYLVADFPYFRKTASTQSLTDGDNYVANLGNVPTSPIFSVTGPATTPTFSVTQGSNTYTLELIEDVPSGQRLELNASFGQKTAQFVDVVTGDRTDVFESLTNASLFFDLMTGTNTIAYTGGGVVSVDWSDLYQSVL